MSGTKQVNSKQKYRIKNWKQYNKALKQRGSVSLWIDESVAQSGMQKRIQGKKGIRNFMRAAQYYVR